MTQLSKLHPFLSTYAGLGGSYIPLPSHILFKLLLRDPKAFLRLSPTGAPWIQTEPPDDCQHGLLPNLAPWGTNGFPFSGLVALSHCQSIELFEKLLVWPLTRDQFVLGDPIRATKFPGSWGT